MGEAIRQINTYDPAYVLLQVNGTYITGFSEKSMIKIEKNEDNVTPYVGVRGEVNYAYSYDETGKATISLASTSPHLPYLRSIANRHIPFNFTMTDLNDNGENISADDCMIIKPPDVSREKEVEDVEIEIFIPYLSND